MNDDRDRRAAREFVRGMGMEDCDEFAATVEDLAAFRAAARAEGAAEMREACSKVVGMMARGRRLAIERGGPEFMRDQGAAFWLSEADKEIRALAPAGLVAVATDNLEWLLSEADTCEMRMPTSNPRLREERDEIVTRVRAALARKEG